MSETILASTLGSLFSPPDMKITTDRSALAVAPAVRSTGMMHNHIGVNPHSALSHHGIHRRSSGCAVNGCVPEGQSLPRSVNAEVSQRATSTKEQTL